VLGKYAERALLPKTTGELAPRLGGGVRCRCSLRSGATSDEDHRAQQLLAPLDGIDKRQLELVKIMYRLHGRFSPRFPTLGGELQSDARMSRASP
jgi:hypothetical protein